MWTDFIVLAVYLLGFAAFDSWQRWRVHKRRLKPNHSLILLADALWPVMVYFAIGAWVRLRRKRK